MLDRPLHPAAVRARFGDGLSARRMTRVARCPNPAVRGAYGHRSPLPRLGQSNDPDTAYLQPIVDSFNLTNVWGLWPVQNAV